MCSNQSDSPSCSSSVCADEGVGGYRNSFSFSLQSCVRVCKGKLTTTMSQYWSPVALCCPHCCASNNSGSSSNESRLSGSPLTNSHCESSSENFSINSKDNQLIIPHHHTSACQKSHYSLHSTGRRRISRTHSLTNHSDSGWRPFLHLLLGLLLLFQPRFAMSSPLRMQDTGSPSSSSSDTGEHVRHQRPAKWINPCRIPKTVPSLPADFDVQQQSDVDIFQNIITQVSKAEHQAREFMPDFFEDSFGLKLEQERDKFKDLHQDWMADVAKTVGKYLGEEVDPTRLEELSVEETLRSMYEGLQKFAVGLEQIVLDQAVYGGNYHQHFHEAEFQLKYVLCELQIAMLEKSITYQDITREIMSQSYRDLDSKTARDIRDWLIFRDYVNVLEYLKQVFKHFLHKANRHP